MRLPATVFLSRFLVMLFALFSSAENLAQPPLPPVARRIFDRAAQEKHFTKAIALYPEIFPTSDGKSFVGVWRPAGVNPSRWIVSLHGSQGFATNDLAIWQPFLARHGFGLVCLQWWLGIGDQRHDYYAPHEIYREIDIVLTRLGVQPHSALLHGFSRGSANLYAVAALDASHPKHYFSLFVANAGGASRDFPPNRALDEGRFGTQPLAKTDWVTICGGRDPNPERDGCPAMRATAKWLMEHGAQIVTTIEDPDGDHGAFHRNARLVERVLDLFASKAGSPIPSKKPHELQINVPKIGGDTRP